MKEKIIIIPIFISVIALVGCGQGSFDNVEQTETNLELGSVVDISKTISWNEENIANVELKDDGGFDINKIGEYTATYTITNIKENTKDIQFTYNVVDTTAPTIQVNTAEQYVKKGDVFDIHNYANATDKSGTQILEMNGEVDSNKEGTYSITVFAMDEAGNKSEEKSITVIVEDRSDCIVRNAKWGDSVETVKNYEDAELLEDTITDGVRVLLYKAKLAGVDCVLGYCFNEYGQLYKVSYTDNSNHINPDGFIVDYNSFVEAVTEKYGKSTDSDEAKGYLFNYCSSVGEALQIGQYVVFEEWDIDDEHYIICGAFNDNNRILVKCEILCSENVVSHAKIDTGL